MNEPAPPCWEWRGDSLLLAIKVLPRGSRNELLAPRDERLPVRLQAPPVEGRANRALIEYLARTFGVSKSQVSIVNGENSRLKRVAVTAPKRLPAFIPPSD